MGKAHSRWKPLPHEPIEKLADNLWFVRGSLPGMSLQRTMVVARRANGDLVIHNGIALEPGAQAELEAWGRPAVLVVPSGVHRLDAKAYKERFPELRVVAPPAAKKKVEEVVPVDATYDDAAVSTDDVQLETLRSTGGAEGVMRVRSPDGVTVVFNDVVFNMDRRQDFLGNAITSLLGSVPGPRVSRLAKLLLVKDKKGLAADLERFASLPDLVRVIVAHDKVASGDDARSMLRAAARCL